MPIWYTVWNCQDFSVIQILREINFEQYIKSKTAGFFIFWGLDFVNFIYCILQIVETLIEIKIQSLYMFKNGRFGSFLIPKS